MPAFDSARTLHTNLGAMKKYEHKLSTALYLYKDIKKVLQNKGATFVIKAVLPKGKRLSESQKDYVKLLPPVEQFVDAAKEYATAVELVPKGKTLVDVVSEYAAMVAKLPPGKTLLDAPDEKDCQPVKAKFIIKKRSSG